MGCDRCQCERCKRRFAGAPEQAQETRLRDQGEDDSKKVNVSTLDGGATGPGRDEQRASSSPCGLGSHEAVARKGAANHEPDPLATACDPPKVRPRFIFFRPVMVTNLYRNGKPLSTL
jgi:hypothetical protein